MSTQNEKIRNYGHADSSVVYFNTSWWYITQPDIKPDVVKNGEWFVCCDVLTDCPYEDLDALPLKYSKRVILDRERRTYIWRIVRYAFIGRHFILGGLYLI